jgi:DNA modification methylase
MLTREERIGGDAPQGRLIRADNLAALTALAGELAGRVDLVYVDPPFLTAADWGDFDDRWPSPADYLAMLEARFRLLHTLLSPRGALFVHLDWHACHLVRAQLGQLFGEHNSLGEIIWAYGSPSGGRTAGAKLVKSHDVLLWFAKARGEHIFHALRVPYSERYLRDWFRYVDDDGRRYRKRWRARGQVERQYLDESPGMPLSTVWTDIQQIYADPRAYREHARSDITGYPTQKPVKLLERIVSLASEPGSIVLDAFCGSGTTLVAAARLGRRFVGIDQSARAVHIARRRLLAMDFGFEVWASQAAPAAAAPKCTVRAAGREVRVELAAEAQARADVWQVEFEPGVTRRTWRERGQVAATLTHTYATPGRYAVRLCLAEADGSVAERRLPVRVR